MSRPTICNSDGDTSLTGSISDQAALYGLLVRLRDLGLTLVSVTYKIHDTRRFEMIKVQEAIFSKSRRAITIVSPFVIGAITWLTAWLLAGPLDVWVWVPITLVYWAAMGGLVTWGGGRQAASKWFRASRGSWLWRALAVLMTLWLVPVMFLPNWRLLLPLYVWLPWLLVALVNPCLEECYWRGLLLDATDRWPGWLAFLYSSLLFSASHLVLGVRSIASRHPNMLISVLVLGLIWSLIRRKTGSLRWSIFSHFLVDLFTMSVAAFLNLYIPPS